jgi:hypothetical protein
MKERHSKKTAFFTLTFNQNSFLIFKPELLESITSEEHINLFAKMLNKSNNKEFDDKTNRLFKIIYESVIQETFDFVGVMLRLDKEVESELTSLFIHEIRILNYFYRLIPTKSNNIVSKEFLTSISNRLDNKIRSSVKSVTKFP